MPDAMTPHAAPHLPSRRRPRLGVTGAGLALGLALAASALAPTQGWAQEADSPATFKLTTGYYHYAHDHGSDVNLRWEQADTHAWVGHYQDGSFGAQDRAGVDTNWAVNDTLSLQPSVQVATGQFVGGSLNAQVGHVWYGLAGWGRTNLKPYFNLNFDPNDAITLGAGHQFDEIGRAHV